ncbi:MAG: acetyltransferase, partial [Lachnospiraceae bacterium]|nr:acetyltransferase [Lachnospiraceae bacterium]
MEQLHLTELFDVEILQQLQDSFFNALGIAAGILDEKGKALTNRVFPCEFCFKYTKLSEEGVKRCTLCDKQGIESAKQQGKPVIYTCHAGLVDFMVPIMLEGQLLGCFTGGQVLLKPLSEENVRAYAEELGIDPEEYAKAAKEIPIISRDRIESMANLLYDIGKVFSRIAYNQYVALQVSGEMKREAHMKSDFLANMSHEI